jgi:tRNA A-37 threonylcarbamoyl transferase component Bud32
VALPEVAHWLAGDQACFTCVKEQRKRSVYALRAAPDAPVTYYLKYDHPRELRDRLKSWLRPRVRREYRAAAALHAAGVPVAEPIACAWVETEGLLVTRALPGARDAVAAWQECRAEPARRAAYLAGLSAFLGVLVRCGVRHPDLHLGNVLVAEAPAGLAFCLTDLYGCTLAAPDDRAWRERTLAVLNGLRVDLTPAEVTAVLGPLCGGAPAAAALWDVLLSWQIADLRARWHGRRAKLLGDSSFALRSVTEDGLWRRRAGGDPRVPEAAVRMHRNVVFNAPEELLKDDTKRRLSRVAVAGTYYVVKEFRRPGPWGRWAPDCRSWLANWRLEMSGMPVPRYYGWLRDRRGTAFLVMEFFPGPTLDVALTQGTPAVQDALLEATAGLLRQLTRWGIVHQDLKAQNLIVRSAPGEPVRLGLVDNDAVRFDQRVTAADWTRNLRQLAESLPAVPEVRRRFDRFAAGLTSSGGSCGE